MLAAIALRLPSFWEHVRYFDEACALIDPFLEDQYGPILAASYFYQEIFNFYIMTAVQAFLPFLFLVILNIGMIVKLRQKLSVKAARQRSVSWLFRSNENLKTGIHTIVAIVTLYLVCNSLDLVIKFLEFVAPMPILVSESGGSTDFYRFSTDFISIFFLFNSSVRICIYLACNSEIRWLIFAKVLRRPSTQWGSAPNGEMPNHSIKKIMDEELHHLLAISKTIYLGKRTVNEAFI